MLTGPVKRAAVVIALALAAAMAPSGCAQILGADQSFSLDVQIAGDAGGAVDGAHDFETSTVAPCPPGQKTCAGACVAADNPEYGCDPTSCRPPCSLPHVPVATCVDSECAVGTCAPGWADCNNLGIDGCEADTTSTATCNSCKVACQLTELCAPPPTGCTKDCGSLTACGDGRCVDTTTSTADCGGCVSDATGRACIATPADHANAVCNPTPSSAASDDGGTDGGDDGGGGNVVGVCGFNCDQGYGDCNHDPSDGCEQVLVPYFADVDGDGFGAGTALGLACTVPTKMSGNALDCQDQNPLVHPGQATYFPMSYTKPNGAQSFDYNCDNNEEADPGVPTGGTCTPTCANGYTATGTTANPYCGSTSRIGCVLSSGTVLCDMLPPSPPVGCR